MRVDFHFNVEDRLQYACRVVRKARAADKTVLAYAREPARLARFDAALWIFSALDFVPHVYVDAPLATRTPVLLTLDATLRVIEPLPRTRVGFEIVRSDGMVMFNGSPMIDGEPPLDLEAGTALTVRVQFQANVLRGSYRIVMHLVDAHKLWRAIDISGLASFVVHETTRVAGCAEVHPAYELRASAPARILRVV